MNRSGSSDAEEPVAEGVSSPCRQGHRDAGSTPARSILDVACGDIQQVASGTVHPPPKDKTPPPPPPSTFVPWSRQRAEGRDLVLNMDRTKVQGIHYIPTRSTTLDAFDYLDMECVDPQDERYLAKLQRQKED